MDLNEASLELIASQFLTGGQSWRMSPTRMVVSPQAYKFALWEFGELARWKDRDRRRIKPERRKFLATH